MELGSSLPQLDTIIRSKALDYHAEASYKAVGEPFIDGLQIDLGDIPVTTVSSMRVELAGHVHSIIPEVTINALTVNRRGQITSIWITLAHDCAVLNHDTVYKIKRILKAVKEYFSGLPIENSHLNSNFKVTKVDTTLDLVGSFLPETGLPI